MSLTRKAGSHLVYNMTVEADHVYYVGGLTALVHNDCPELWKLTSDGADKIAFSGRFGKFFRSSSDGRWWSVDNAGHGESAFKVYEETSTGLKWIADADEYGNFIVGKHKGPTGLFIPWSELSGVQ